VSATPDLITRVLVGANVAVYLLQVLAPQVTGLSWMYGLAVASGQWWRLLTAGFVHLSLVHILFNMWSLWVLGRLLEEMLGRVRFVALYAISLLGASTVSYLFASPEGRAAGASGAVFGLAGGLIVVAKRMNWKLQWLVGMIGLNLLLPLVVSNIDWHAHVGGLVTGMVTTAAFVYSPRRWRVGAAYAVLVVVAVVCVGLVAQRSEQIRQNPRYASIFTLGGGVSGNDEQYRPFP
jgi:membrane associated rhomboid family serine protease